MRTESSGTYRVKLSRRGKARPGSSRWFRRYRWLVISGWLLVGMVVVWIMFIRSESVPAKSSADAVAAHPAPTTQNVAEMPAVRLPADDAVHEALTEWWYYSGHLQTDSGERYSFHMAAFLRRGTLTHTVFQGSLLDHQTEQIYTEQARTAGNPSDGRTNGFGFNFGNWQLQGTGAEHAAKMAGKDFALDLKLKDALQPVLHQAPGTPVAGLLDFGSAGKSYYTSRPRMAAQGTLSIGGTIKAVRGEVWFDHQWGDFEAASLRWNWFALQLGDGADLMLFELFDRQGAAVLRMGTYAKDGAVSALGAADFAANSRGTWKSPASGVLYPINWTISIPARGLQLKVDPAQRASEFDARTTTLNVYWEGAVKVSGSQAGVGFMELSGYQAPADLAVKKPAAVGTGKSANGTALKHD
ncbi:MAG: lipocalin family protein [Candidatus Accumulibacter propinquus]|jgi:predicted secreted hydrolase